MISYEMYMSCRFGSCISDVTIPQCSRPSRPPFVTPTAVIPLHLASHPHPVRFAPRLLATLFRPTDPHVPYPPPLPLLMPRPLPVRARSGGPWAACRSRRALVLLQYALIPLVFHGCSHWFGVLRGSGPTPSHSLEREKLLCWRWPRSRRFLVWVWRISLPACTGKVLSGRADNIWGRSGCEGSLGVH